MTRTFRFLLGAAAVAASAATAPAQTERFWTVGDAGLTGDFDDPDQWVDGDTLGIPGLPDTAIFDQPGFYTVHFPASQATDRVVVRRGFVIFELGTPYTLVNGIPLTPAVVVGETDVDTAGLTLRTGVVQSEFTHVGSGAGSFGWLTVDGPGAALLNLANLHVGDQGAGILEIVNQAQVSNGTAAIGAGAGSFGDVTVSGLISFWGCAGTLAVGKGGAGGLTIEDSGAVISGSALPPRSPGPGRPPAVSSLPPCESS